MYFGIFDEKRVTNLKLRGKKTLLVRIFEPNSNKNDYPQINNIKDYHSILELYIKDFVTPPQTNELTKTFIQLNKFILDEDFDEIIVHCRLGISRSPAIMICISKILNNSKLEQTVKENFKCYNKFIVEEFKKFPYVSKNIEQEDLSYEHSMYLTKPNSNSLQSNNLIINQEDENTLTLSYGTRKKTK